MSIAEALRAIREVKEKYPLTLGSDEHYPDKCRRGGENSNGQPCGCYDEAA